MLYAYGYMCHERCSVAVSNARRQGYRATTTTVVRHAGLRTELGLGGALGAEGDGQRHASLTDSRCGVADPFCEGVCPPAHVLCSRVGLLLVTRPRASVAVVVCERFDCARIGAAALHALQVLLAPSIWWEAFGMVAERGMPALPSLLVCYGSFHR
jgi:hypothetical protein